MWQAATRLSARSSCVSAAAVSLPLRHPTSLLFSLAFSTFPTYLFFPLCVSFPFPLSQFDPPNINEWEALDGGGSGDVYSAEFTPAGRSDRIKVAIKHIDTTTPKNELSFQREVLALAVMNGHPNIPKLHGSFINEAGGFIVLERFTYNLFKASKSKLTQGQLNYSSLMRDVACALAFMKSKGHIHRDCKLGNILLPKDCKRAVLADFGETRTPPEQMSGKAGTAQYRAVEMRDGKYGWEVDVLAFGQTLGVLRQCLTNSQIKTDADWMDFCVKACTRKDRYERPLIEQVFKALNVIAENPSRRKEADVQTLLTTDAKANKAADEQARAQRVAAKLQEVEKLKAAAAKLKAITTKAGGAAAAAGGAGAVAARNISTSRLKTGPKKGAECGRQRPCRYHH
jgi:hypothetical protein